MNINYTAKDGLESMKCGSGSDDQGHGGPSAFVLHPAIVDEELHKERMDSVGQELVSKLMSKTGFWFLWQLHGREVIQLTKQGKSIFTNRLSIRSLN